MKIELNENGFSADMGSERHGQSIFKFLYNRHLTFFFGCLSLALSFLLIGMYILFNYVAELFVFIFGFTDTRNIVFILIPYFMIAVIAIAFSIISVVYFRKRNLCYPLSGVGLLFSVISFFVCMIFLFLSILLIFP